MSEDSSVFNRDNLDTYLKELAKEYKKLGGKSIPAEIVLIGGAATIANYSFRDMTTDVDAIINAASAMKEAIGRVGDRYNLPHRWINTDFVKTKSYSRKLLQFSVYYKTFSNVLRVRTVMSEYLIAMKLCSGRKYKNDLSDIIGILAEHERRDDHITYERIDKAVKDLYGSWNEIPQESEQFIKDTLKNGEYEKVYSLVKDGEKEAKEVLVEFTDIYKEAVLKESNVDEILKKLMSKMKEKKEK